MQELLDRMCSRVVRHATDVRMDTPVPGLGIGMVRAQGTAAPVACSSGICLVLQGAKRMIVGERWLRYAAGDSFASLIELPSTRSAVETEPDKPYVATSLRLNPDAIEALLPELPADPYQKGVPPFGVASVSAELLDAWDRYLALLDSPDDIAVLGPLRERELLYRLLQGPHGPLLRKIARKDGRLAQVRHVIAWLQQHFDEAVPIGRLAELANMSTPSFNRHFKAATTLSPLQYQKMLRLQAARRLLSTNANVAQSAFAVGYESPSQFSREYARLFGVSPRDDAAGMRSAADAAIERA